MKLGGFGARFYQQFWSIVGDDIHTLVLDAINYEAMLSSLNYTYIALASWVNIQINVNDFRSISLYNVIYKIVSKVIYR